LGTLEILGTGFTCSPQEAPEHGPSCFAKSHSGQSLGLRRGVEYCVEYISSFFLELTEDAVVWDQVVLPENIDDVSERVWFILPENIEDASKAALEPNNERRVEDVSTYVGSAAALDKTLLFSELDSANFAETAVSWLSVALVSKEFVNWTFVALSSAWISAIMSVIGTIQIFPIGSEATSAPYTSMNLVRPTLVTQVPEDPLGSAM
jgi:hypothetical protein